MAFVKTGDAQPIISTHDGDYECIDEETKKTLEAMKQAARNTDENEDDSLKDDC